ncbi:MAG: hypothetical protein QNL62_20900 [Gammaproteobacteria bacterium]|nr:hypothetical protein [Gammaproteobacteria bacterium]
MAKTWIVGIGSFYANDHIGLDVTQYLEQQYQQTLAANDIYFFTTNAPHELLALMAVHKDKNIQRLYVIDALQETDCAENINLYSLEDLQAVRQKTSGHIAGLQESLQLIQCLYFPALSIRIIGIPVTLAVCGQNSFEQLSKTISHLINTTS